MTHRRNFGTHHSPCGGFLEQRRPAASHILLPDWAIRPRIHEVPGHEEIKGYRIVAKPLTWLTNQPLGLAT